MTKKDKMKKALLSASLPSVHIRDLPLADGSGTRDVTIQYRFKQADTDGNDDNNVREDAPFVLMGRSEPDDCDFTIDINGDTIKRYMEGVISLDELCISSEIKYAQCAASDTILNQVEDIDRSRLSSEFLEKRVSMEDYVPQDMTLHGEDMTEKVIQIMAQSMNKTKADIPEEYRVVPPKSIVPEKPVLAKVFGYLAEGTPCVAMVGPTGVGKSYLARYILSRAQDRGMAGLIIDANARTEGDRLFDRDDFDADGTFVLEGTLTTFARKTKELGLKGIVVLEEYNAFSDETRREFYRLFSDEDRYYRIESSKNGEVMNQVDFSHIQFLMTANPITSDRYLVDDLKRLSNAEARRVTMVYHDYSDKVGFIKKVFHAIIKKKPVYSKLLGEYPELPKAINLDRGVQCFKLLNKPSKDGNGLGFDFGYTAVANWIWTACIYGNTSSAWMESSIDHLINPIPDPHVRDDVANRLETKFGIRIPASVVYRDA